MADNIHRISTLTQSTLLLTNSQNTSATFSMSGKAGALLHCLSTSTNAAVTVQFYSIPDERTNSAFALCDISNNLVSLTIQANRCYALPDDLFAAMKIQIVITSNATAECRVSFKT